MHNVVSTEWLAGEMGRPDLIIFDCSTYLPNEPGNKKDGFRAGHIPGARLFDIDVIAYAPSRSDRVRDPRAQR
jgi:thiosulfate/3-mercaptopyruvate sulfurtransferase